MSEKDQEQPEVIGHSVMGFAVVQSCVDILKKLPYETVAHVMPALLNAAPIRSVKLKAARPAPPDDPPGDGKEPEDTKPETH